MDSQGGILVRMSGAQALRMFRRAAELGDTNGMVLLANSLSRLALKQKPSERTRLLLEEAMRWERKALRRGGSTAAFNLAMSLLHLGRAHDAVRRFRKLAEEGDDSALLEVARAELLAVGTRRNVVGAMAKFRRVARKGSNATEFDREAAMILLATTSYEGWLVRRNYRAAVKWLRRAAAVGSAAARGMLQDLGEAVQAGDGPSRG